MSKFSKAVGSAVSKIVKKGRQVVNKAIAEAQLENVQARLDKGIGVDDSPMPPVTEKYAKARKRNGDIRTIWNSGRLRKSLVIKSTDDGMVRWIQTKGGRNEQVLIYTNKKHKWFGISKKDKDILLTIARKVLLGKNERS